MNSCDLGLTKPHGLWKLQQEQVEVQGKIYHGGEETYSCCENGRYVLWYFW